MIFPRLEETRIKISMKPESEQDVATEAFLDLLEWFRIVILQDAVFLRAKFPSLKLWMSPPFNSPLFEDFAEHLLHEASHGQDPLFEKIANAQPLIARMMQDQHRNTLSTMSMYHQSTAAQITEVGIQLNTCLNSMQPMADFMRRLSTPGGVQMRTQLNLLDNDAVVAATVAGEPQPVIAGHVEKPTDDGNIEQYRLDSGVTTITRLWEEYDKGIVSKVGMPRGPSIRDLNAKFGAKWRAQENFRKAYTRRRHIWEAIIRVSENLNTPPDRVAEKMERWRVNHHYSLQKVDRMLLEVARGASPLWGERDIELRHVI